MMDHPNIARVFDGGATASGRPFFVMELVRGIPVTDYCDRERLSIPERLELFVLVCRAVQHAHQKGIIHRDLKPSNILVTVIDGAAVPKVIDFGVAKATGGSLTERTVYTAFHQFVGTPLYMSPEQADLSGMDVDTRSDIYSLGVLLYELLTGTTPFDAETLRQAAFDEVRRIIREQEPPRPSTRLSSLGATRTTISANRKADERQLDRAVRGELDWIVMKALEKDRNRRYETANGLAADVRRYLDDEPVQACPPSARYRFSKYVRRHRAALTTAALIGITLVAGTTLSVWQAVLARRAEAESSRRAEESRQVVEFLVRDLFGWARLEKGEPFSSDDLLTVAEKNLSDRFRRQPLVEASIRVTLSRWYFANLQFDDALRHATRAAELRGRFLGFRHPDTLEARTEHVWVLSAPGFGSPAVAETCIPPARRLLVDSRRTLGEGHELSLRVQSILAQNLNYAGHHAEAERIAAEAEALAIQSLGPDHGTTFFAQVTLGQAVSRRGDYDRAGAILQQCFVNHERVFGPINIFTYWALKYVVENLINAGRFDEALPRARELADRACRVFGTCHINASWPIYAVEMLLRRRGDLAGIRDFDERLLREVLSTPVEPGQGKQERRVIRLAKALRSLVTLPDDIPVDLDLAARAGEEARRLSDGKSGCVTLALGFARMGRTDLALESLQKAKSHPDWAKNEDDYAWLVEAEIRARRGELEETRRLYDQARARPEPVAFGREEYKSLQSSVEAMLSGSAPPAVRPRK
jgi:serine/threonine protein kinase